MKSSASSKDISREAVLGSKIAEEDAEEEDEIDKLASRASFAFLSAVTSTLLLRFRWPAFIGREEVRVGVSVLIACDTLCVDAGKATATVDGDSGNVETGAGRSLVGLGARAAMRGLHRSLTGEEGRGGAAQSGEVSMLLRMLFLLLFGDLSALDATDIHSELAVVEHRDVLDRHEVERERGLVDAAGMLRRSVELLDEARFEIVGKD